MYVVHQKENITFPGEVENLYRTVWTQGYQGSC
jgi:hypothetical protein